MMLEGVLNVDKPQGLTSHDVVSVVRRLAKLRRVGHAGTLDPLATGVLLLCLGRATRLVEYLMGQPKQYEAAVRLGQETNTYDAEGEVVAERPFNHISAADIANALTQFRGPIQQQPPMYSAIKKDGQPLYKFARKGQEVERPFRTVHLYHLELTAWEPPFLHLALTCSSGTYVRSLAHDVGQLLGCGGHITALRRTAIGEFMVADAVPLEALTPDTLPDYLRPPETAVRHLPPLQLNEADTRALQMGQPVLRQSAHPDQPEIRIYDPNDEFIGIAALKDEYWQAKKIFAGIH